VFNTVRQSEWKYCSYDNDLQGNTASTPVNTTIEYGCALSRVDTKSRAPQHQPWRNRAKHDKFENIVFEKVNQFEQKSYHSCGLS